MGNTGYLASPLCCEEGPPASDRRERALPPRGRVGWKQAADVQGDGGGGGISPPCGPGQPGQPGLPGIYLRNAASWPIWREFDLISVKLVKTAKCRQKVSIRPVIVPNLKTGPRIHLLEFWDFRFPCLLSQGINGPILTVPQTLWSK